MQLRPRQRGDTIIEVLLAITIFSLVAVGVMVIMNQSTNAAQRAIEITLVRQQIDAQAEAIRAAHSAYVSLDTDDIDARNDSTWQAITDHADTVSINTSTGCPGSAAFLSSVFVMNTREAIKATAPIRAMTAATAPLYPQTINSPASSVTYGMWIERNFNSPANPNIAGSYDFRIRTCWLGAGSSTAPMQMETVVRLYDVS